MKEYSELTWLMERIIHKYSQFEKKPQQYCKNITLTQPEIHTVAIIGDQEGINVTTLAKMRGITKGAASQMIYRLVDKDLVEKRISPNSDSEINLFLTEKGKQARKEHRARHKSMSRKFEAVFDNVPEEMRVKLIDFLKEFEKELDGVERSRS